MGGLDRILEEISARNNAKLFHCYVIFDVFIYQSFKDQETTAQNSCSKFHTAVGIDTKYVHTRPENLQKAVSIQLYPVLQLKYCSLNALTRMSALFFYSLFCQEKQISS